MGEDRRDDDPNRSTRRSAVRLRTIAHIGNALLALLALLVSSTFVVLTTMLEQVSTQARQAGEATRAADSVRIDLLSYGRVSDLAYLAQTPQSERARTRVEAELIAHLRDVRVTSTEDAQRELLREGESRVQEYLAARREAERRDGDVQSVVIQATPALSAALETMDRLATLDLSSALRAEEKALRWNRVANIIGVTAMLLVLLGFATVSAGTNRLVLGPLMALSDAIERFAAGNRDARVSLRGTAEFQGVAANFNEMARRIEQQHADLLTFLAGVAHDLRNPLAALRLSAQRLREDRPLPSESAIRRTISLVDRQVTRLERMVEDFLDACRIEGGHLDLVPSRHDLRDIARDAVELYEQSSPSHRLLLRIPADAVLVECDGERIAQVLNNLLSNAIKYSPKGGLIRVSVTHEADGGGSVVVTDEGIGIASDDQAHVFEPFRRTVASRETAAGVGLGLSVSRKIVEAHGGRISLQSELGIGTTFRVHLPRKIAGGSAPAPVLQPPPVPEPA